MPIRRRKVDLSTGMVRPSTRRGQKEPETSEGIVVLSDLVSVKKEASEAASVLGYLQNGDHVDIISVVKEYYKIKFGKHQIGYVNNRFVRRLDNASGDQ